MHLWLFLLSFLLWLFHKCCISFILYSFALINFIQLRHWQFSSHMHSLAFCPYQAKQQSINHKVTPYSWSLYFLGVIRSKCSWCVFYMFPLVSDKNMPDPESECIFLFVWSCNFVGCLLKHFVNIVIWMNRILQLMEQCNRFSWIKVYKTWYRLISLLNGPILDNSTAN